MEKVYNPKSVESKWYNFWLENLFFSSEPDDREPFVIVIPPPNVTGVLHIGHALNNTLQDIIIRYKRMQGYNTLWVPGTDHGGIATQNVVERMLLEKGIKRQDLAREDFLKEMQNWRNKTGDRILQQLKLLGCSCDWHRAVFTMDEDYSRVVLEAFVRLFNLGLIYRGKRIVNRCVRCQTALADIEVEHKEIDGKLWYIKYPFKDKKGFITVATTRPETMLGDTAVAVHPNDDRYKELIGKIVILPLMNREIPIIGDEFVKPEFGTGAVKVTPAHDPVDFEIAQRKNLPFVFVIDYAGKMTNEAKQYAGLERYECREKVLADLKELGLIEKIEDYKYSVGICYRCSTVVEPIISEQWFLSVKEISKRAIEAIESGKVKFYPHYWKEFCIDWLKNLKDWCISRQIWWGHRIPVYYCKKGCRPIASIDKPDTCQVCGCRELQQDDDVLDTWFSSALWPFGVFKWPRENKDLNYYYPTSVLVTGYEILYFWVARMLQFGLFFMNDIPFQDVYIHGIIRDVHGRKMSKSLGNIIDPIDVINEYGTDALRFALAGSAGAGKDITLSYEDFIGARNFMNKIWNAARYILEETKDLNSYDISSTTFIDKWIWNEIKNIILKIQHFMDEYRINEVCVLLYNFFWKQYCDWYIEVSKVNIRDIPEFNNITKKNLLKTFELLLRLFHPVIPFITEEIWQKIKDQLNINQKSIMIQKFPTLSEIPELKDLENSMKKMKWIMEIVKNVRSIRGELRIPPKIELTLIVKTESDETFNLFNSFLPYFRFLCKLMRIERLDDIRKMKSAAGIIVENIYGFIPLGDIVDIEKESNRLKTEVIELEGIISELRTKLENEKFTNRAPQEEVLRVRKKLEELTARKTALENILSNLLPTNDKNG